MIESAEIHCNINKTIMLMIITISEELVKSLDSIRI